VNRLAVIAAGGVLGSLARFAVALALGLEHWDPSRLPWATLTVNMLGCLAIGMVAASPAVASGPDWLRPFLITGVLGGFTTFSALALETGLLLDDGQILVAVTYILITMVFGLLAVRLGALMVGRSA
jgi:CrcB protein